MCLQEWGIMLGCQVSIETLEPERAKENSET
jgi:hypothetical protein